MVSVKDVAAAASVSVGTVSNVLNHPERVTPPTVERVQRAIAELGFVRNDAARQLRVGRSRSIGLIVLDVGNPFFAEVVRGADARAAESNMAVLVAASDLDPAREDDYLELFREQRVSGVLITPTTEDESKLLALHRSGTPVVLLDRESQGPEFCSVAVDDIEGGRLAAAHLLELGRRRLAYLCGPLGNRQVADRLEGARRAVDAVSGARLEIIGMDTLTVVDGRKGGRRITERPAAERPDAVFAANDLLAVGALEALVLRGDVRVPDDIALIGYDDIDFAATTLVPLSSIRQPAAQLGYTAVDLLLADAAGRTEAERHAKFQPELVVRASTAG